MRWYQSLFLAAWLGSQAALADDLPPRPLSDAPLQAINAYIENSGTCSEQVVDWNRRYHPKLLSGEIPRNFYYRVLGFIDWGGCGRPHFRSLFAELQKIWFVYAKGRVTAEQFEAKEAEVINLFFASLEDPEKGAKMVRTYEGRIMTRLIREPTPMQYFNCTYFGDEVKCTD